MRERLALKTGAAGAAFLVGPPAHRLSVHRHDELEVNVVISGKASYLFGTRRVPLFPTSMIWLFPRQDHVLIDCSAEFSMWVLVFRPGMVRVHSRHARRVLLRSLDPGEILCRQIDSRTVNFLNGIYQGASEAQADLEFQNTALAHGLVASWQAFQFSRETLPRTDVHTAVAKAARLLSREDGPISLNQLAREAGLSASRLSRLFHLQMGVRLTTFRQRKCLENFLRLYRTGARYSLTEAALLAGFGSYPQFHRVFSQLMDMSPAAYRRSVAATVTQN